MNMIGKQMATILARHWWVLLLRGIMAVLFGVLAWMMPSLSLMALIILFGAYALADGILGVWTAFTGRKEQEHWWVLLLWGLVSMGIGILTFAAPGVTTIILVFYIAIWAIATGVLQVVAAIRLRKEITGEWLLILAGAASIIFGVALVAQPALGALALLWLIATYAVIFGALLVILAFKARGFGRNK